MIKIYEPYINEITKKYAHEAIESGWISSQGEFIQKTTDKLSEILNTKNLFLVSNGTTGMHCVSKAISLAYPKINTLIVPNNSYVAAWNAFLYDNNFKLVSVDCDINTWNYNIEELFDLLNKSNLDETALLCVHNLGNIINIDKIKDKYPQLVIIEDNCEGLFGKYNNKYSGTDTLASAVSFFGNKTITCGEGGAVIINQEETKEYLKSFINQGNTNKKFIHNKIAQNYRMTNIQAALLLGQLESLSEIREKKENIFLKYRKAFLDNENMTPQKQEENTECANWMFGLKFKNINYNFAFNFYEKNGIDTRPMFYSHEKQEYLRGYINSYKTNTNANTVNEKTIILPSYPSLTDEQVNYIIKKTFELLKEK